MDPRKIKQAVDLAAATGHVLVATASYEGVPHLAAARKLSATPAGELSVSEWFCPGTIANLDQNVNISIVAWDARSDSGFQIIGRVRRIEDLAILDGNPGDVTEEVPQVQKRLIIQPEKVIHFSHAPHSDIEE